MRVKSQQRKARIKRSLKRKERRKREDMDPPTHRRQVQSLHIRKKRRRKEKVLMGLTLSKCFYWNALNTFRFMILYP